MAAVIAYFREGGITARDRSRIQADALEVCRSAAIPSLIVVGTPYGLVCGEQDPLDLSPGGPGLLGVGRRQRRSRRRADDRREHARSPRRRRQRSAPIGPAARRRRDGPARVRDRRGRLRRGPQRRGRGHRRHAAARHRSRSCWSCCCAIYRSPLVARCRSVVVAVAYLVAAGLIYGLVAADLTTVSGQTTAILIVLMFGVGTDYCLLIVARYPRRAAHAPRIRATAMARATEQTGPAILSAGAIVVAAMLVLAVADFNATREMGPLLALGVAVMVAAGLTLLPARARRARDGARSGPRSRAWRPTPPDGPTRSGRASAAWWRGARRPSPRSWLRVPGLGRARQPRRPRARWTSPSSSASRPSRCRAQQLIRERFGPGRAAPLQVRHRVRGRRGRDREPHGGPGDARSATMHVTAMAVSEDEAAGAVPAPEDLALAEGYLRFDPFSDAGDRRDPGHAAQRPRSGGRQRRRWSAATSPRPTTPGEALARDTRLIVPISARAGPARSSRAAARARDAALRDRDRPPVVRVRARGVSSLVFTHLLRPARERPDAARCSRSSSWSRSGSTTTSSCSPGSARSARPASRRAAP